MMNYNQKIRSVIEYEIVSAGNRKCFVPHNFVAVLYPTEIVSWVPKNYNYFPGDYFTPIPIIGGFQTIIRVISK
jgi:hypothetical protein